MKAWKYAAAMKMLSALLCLIIGFGLAQGSALAESRVELDTPTADAINAIITAATDATTIVLKADAVLDKPIVIPDGKIITLVGASGAGITLGRAIPYSGVLADEYMATVAAGGKLTLGSHLTLDAAGISPNWGNRFVRVEGALVVDGCVMKNGAPGGQGAVVWVYGSKATFQMDSGIITDTTIRAAGTAVVLLLNGPKGILNGGSIQNTQGGDKNYSRSGTVVIDNATFEMHGGEIKTIIFSGLFTAAPACLCRRSKRMRPRQPRRNPPSP